jgi:hypothetical protein
MASWIICRLLTFALSMGIFIACKDNKEVVSNEVQTIPSNSVSYLKFTNLILKHINASINTILKDGNAPNDIQQLRTEIADEDMNNITKTILGKFSGDILQENKKPETLIFYFSEGDIKNPNIDNIIAISFFVSKDKNGLREHHLYTRNNNDNFTLNENYTSSVGNFELGDVNLLASTILKDAKNVKWALYNRLNIKSNTSAQNDDFKKTILNNADFIPYASSITSPCGSVCAVNGSGNCDANGLCSSGGGGGCLASDLNTKSLRVRAKGLDMDFAHNFRDDVLSKTRKGNIYIDYYYKISKIATLNSAVSSDNLLEHINFAHKIYQTAQKFQEDSSNEIIIDEDTKNEFLNFIKYYKTLSNNKEYQQILSDLENDFKDLSGKTRAKVITYLDK